MANKKRSILEPYATPDAYEESKSKAEKSKKDYESAQGKQKMEKLLYGKHPRMLSKVYPNYQGDKDLAEKKEQSELHEKYRQQDEEGLKNYNRYKENR